MLFSERIYLFNITGHCQPKEPWHSGTTSGSRIFPPGNSDTIVTMETTAETEIQFQMENTSLELKDR